MFSPIQPYSRIRPSIRTGDILFYNTSNTRLNKRKTLGSILECLPCLLFTRQYYSNVVHFDNGEVLANQWVQWTDASIIVCFPDAEDVVHPHIMVYRPMNKKFSLERLDGFINKGEAYAIRHLVIPNELSAKNPETIVQRRLRFRQSILDFFKKIYVAAQERPVPIEMEKRARVLVDDHTQFRSSSKKEEVDILILFEASSAYLTLHVLYKLQIIRTAPRIVDATALLQSTTHMSQELHMGYKFTDVISFHGMTDVSHKV